MRTQSINQPAGTESGAELERINLVDASIPRGGPGTFRIRDVIAAAVLAGLAGCDQDQLPTDTPSIVAARTASSVQSFEQVLAFCQTSFRVREHRALPQNERTIIVISDAHTNELQAVNLRTMQRLVENLSIGVVGIESYVGLVSAQAQSRWMEGEIGKLSANGANLPAIGIKLSTAIGPSPIDDMPRLSQIGSRPFVTGVGQIDIEARLAVAPIYQTLLELQLNLLHRNNQLPLLHNGVEGEWLRSIRAVEKTIHTSDPSFPVLDMGRIVGQVYDGAQLMNEAAPTYLLELNHAFNIWWATENFDRKNKAATAVMTSAMAQRQSSLGIVLLGYDHTIVYPGFPMVPIQDCTVAAGCNVIVIDPLPEAEMRKIRVK